MFTNYEPAQIFTLGEPRDFICGIKLYQETYDWITGDWMSVFLVSLDSNDE